MAYEEDEHHPDVPIITLEVISRDSDCYSTRQALHASQYYEEQPDTTLDYLGQYEEAITPKTEPQSEEDGERTEQLDPGNQDASSKSRTDLLEYMTRNDGSVVCKLCGEILQSRTHWYRHKYKLHVVSASPLNSVPLYQCEQCLVYFKSRKGYIGHIASRHGELSDPQTSQLAAAATGSALVVQPPEVVITPVRMKQEPPEPEPPLPAAPASGSYNTTVKISTKTQADGRKLSKSITSDEYLIRAADAEWEERRSREEKLVSDIIDRVRRECEAQGTGGATRRGYTRRTTVMNT